jgi:apolipoprotein N-acyltransferase
MQIFKKGATLNPYLLAIVSGLLLFAAWPMSSFAFLIFIAFVPLLVIANQKMSKRKYFGSIYLAMLIWNVSTTWWIWYASEPGAIGAFVANSFLMTLPWILYRFVKNKFSTTLSYVSLVCFWMMWEFTHLQDWGLSWPWLTVGNVFANKTSWVQWYEITGVSGGTLWVLVINILLYQGLRKYNESQKWKLNILASIALILIPIAYSFLLNSSVNLQITKAQKAPANNIVVVQPNIDPYTKLELMPPERQLEILIETSKQEVDSQTNLLIWPETALYSSYRHNENNLRASQSLEPLFKFLQLYPNLQLFTGIESIKTFDQPTQNSREAQSDNLHYESYNSSVLIVNGEPKQFYHKSMLVPGVETLPWFLNFIGKWFEELGGTTNGYTINKERTVFKGNNNINIAPSICYESIYGAFMSKYVKNGANLIAIITNDGWWRNTPGHQQHFAYAKLRAIENRCYVARSANTGISGFITPNGNTIKSLDYALNGAVAATIPVTSGTTFYTNYPDLLFVIATIIAVLLMLWYNVKIWTNNKV